MAMMHSSTSIDGDKRVDSASEDGPHWLIFCLTPPLASKLLLVSHITAQRQTQWLRRALLMPV